jgi:hypothetical protein
MASLKKRGSTFYIQYYCGAKQHRVSAGTDSLQIAKEKLRQFESAQMRGDGTFLPTKTPLPDIIGAYVTHIRAVKTAKSAQTDIYYLRNMFGDICPALQVTSRKVTAAIKKRPPKPGIDVILAKMEFGGAVESLEIIHLAIRHLTKDIANQLTLRGLGAKELRISFRSSSGAPVEKAVHLIRPSRNSNAMFDLLCRALETIKTATGFTAASLFVTVSERLDSKQATLATAEQCDDIAELDHLVERLRARLERAVSWGELAESNLPENASQFRDNPPTKNPHGLYEQIGLCRPLCLLSQPRSIMVIVKPSDRRDGQPVSFTDHGEVHRLVHIRGPERITGQWWNGRWKTRDYFDALDTEGNRYWLFRVAENGRWFLHGIFE